MQAMRVASDGPTLSLRQLPRRLDRNRVELLAGVLGDDKPDSEGHRDHEDRDCQKSEGEGSRCLL